MKGYLKCEVAKGAELWKVAARMVELADDQNFLGCTAVFNGVRLVAGSTSTVVEILDAYHKAMDKIAKGEV